MQFEAALHRKKEVAIKVIPFAEVHEHTLVQLKKEARVSGAAQARGCAPQHRAGEFARPHAPQVHRFGLTDLGGALVEEAGGTLQYMSPEQMDPACHVTRRVGNVLAGVVLALLTKPPRSRSSGPTPRSSI